MHLPSHDFDEEDVNATVLTIDSLPELALVFQLNGLNKRCAKRLVTVERKVECLFPSFDALRYILP